MDYGKLTAGLTLNYIKLGRIKRALEAMIGARCFIPNLIKPWRG
jgi:hypothetical protein